MNDGCGELIYLIYLMDFRYLCENMIGCVMIWICCWFFWFWWRSVVLFVLLSGWVLCSWFCLMCLFGCVWCCRICCLYVSVMVCSLWLRFRSWCWLLLLCWLVWMSWCWVSRFLSWWRCGSRLLLCWIVILNMCWCWWLLCGCVRRCLVLCCGLCFMVLIWLRLVWC